MPFITIIFTTNIANLIFFYKKILLLQHFFTKMYQVLLENEYDGFDGFEFGTGYVTFLKGEGAYM